MQGTFYAANWLILANFDSDSVISEISVNQVRNGSAYVLGGPDMHFFEHLSVYPFAMLACVVANFSFGQNVHSDGILDNFN